MSRHDTEWATIGEIDRADVLRGTAPRERQAFVRFLAGGEGWEQAARELSGAFAESSTPPAADSGQEE